MGATSRAGIGYPSGAPVFTPGFSGVRITRSLVLYVCFVDRCLCFCSFFYHCVLLRYTDSDPFGIFIISSIQLSLICLPFGST
jgi:hypothetical protein